MKAITASLMVFTFLVNVLAQELKYNVNKHLDLRGSTKEGNILFEGFESGVFPPAGWNLIASGNPQTWDTASFDPFEGNHYVHCLYDESLSSTQNEYLITPTIDLRGFTSALLRFYFQFSKYWGIYPHNNYDLYVLVSTDGGQTFTDTIWNETMVDTATWTSYQWVKAEVSLNNYLNQSQLVLAFVYHGFDGAEASLDQIQVETVGGIHPSSSFSVSFYPNPVQDFLNFENRSPMWINIISRDGRHVLGRTVLPFERVYVGNLPSGTYFLHIVTDNDARASMFIKL